MTVIVVGSGPSGLAAGFRLHQAGHAVRMLEARGEVGGKLRSARRDGFVLDQGAFLFPTTHRRLIAIAEEAGFADRIGPGGFVLATERDGVVHELDGDHLARDFLRTPLLSRRAKLRAARLAPELRNARHATFERMPETAPYDTEPAVEWARRVLDPEVAEYLIATTMRSMFNVSAESLSRVDFLAIVTLLGGAKLVALPGGMGEFSDTVAARFDVVTGAEVFAVQEGPDDVTVTWRDAAGAEHAEAAAGCVLAIPAASALELHPALDGWRRDYMGQVRCGHSFSLNVALSRPPRDLRAVYVQVSPATHPFLVGIGVDHNKAPGRVPAGKGQLTLATLSEWCDERVGDDDATIIGLLLDALEHVLPGMSGDVEFAALNRWRQEFNRVGHYRELGRFRAACETADRRIQLGGDYHSSQSLNAAAFAGERAAARLAKLL